MLTAILNVFATAAMAASIVAFVVVLACVRGWSVSIAPPVGHPLHDSCPPSLPAYESDRISPNVDDLLGPDWDVLTLREQVLRVSSLLSDENARHSSTIWDNDKFARWVNANFDAILRIDQEEQEHLRTIGGFSAPYTV